MDEEQRKYNEQFAQTNAGQSEPKKAMSEEAKVLRIIALLIFGAIVIYLFTANIW